MRVIPPLEITDSILTSTTAVEPAPAYNFTTVYAVGDRVLDPLTNIVYESLIENNVRTYLDNTKNEAWAGGGATTLVHPDSYDAAATYGVGDVVYYEVRGFFSGVSAVNKQFVYSSAVGGNIGNFPSSFGISDSFWTVLPDYPVPWVSTVTYALGRIVRENITSYNIYVSQIASNQNIVPNQIKSWQDVGISNKYRMFNYTSSLKTVAASPLVVTLTPSKRIDSIDLSGLVNVKTVRIQMSVGATSVYDQTIEMASRKVYSYFDYFFQPFTFRKAETKFDLPPYGAGVITVTLTSGGGELECRSLIIGNQFYLGETQYNAKRDYNNYSTVIRNFDGSVNTLVQRPAVPKISQTVFVEKERAQAISEFVLNVDATPIVVSSIDDTSDGYFEPLHAVGFIKSAPIDMAYPTHAILNIEVESISSN